MRVCKNCKYYSGKSKELDVSREYIDGDSTDKPELYMRIGSEFGFIKMCCHVSCFTLDYKYDAAKGQLKIRRRIAGQAQLNKKFNCTFYKRKWWKFWIKGDNKWIK